MDVVRISYRSTEINPSVFLIFYFRLMGIYVQENHIDITREQRESLTIPLPLEDTAERDYLIPEAYIYILCDNNDVDWFGKLCKIGRFDNIKNKIIAIISDRNYFNLKCGEIDSIFKLDYQKETKKEKLLTDINACLKKFDIIKELEFAIFNRIAKIYCENKIYNLNFVGMFSYPDDTLAGFNEIRDKYNYVINEFYKILSNSENEKEKAHIYIQYAMINLKYELDYYCIKCRRPMEYDSRQMCAEGGKLLSCAIDSNMLVDSVWVLVGRIYEDIIMEPSTAYLYYLKACKHFNAYVYFRKGTYWKNYKKYFDRAIMDYRKSIVYFPQYYRAWFNLAQTYLADNNYDEALNAFSKVEIILYKRFRSDVLRTLEIDYLFKTYSCMAYIYQYSGDIYEAIRCYMRAESVWNKIDKSTFWKELNSDVYSNEGGVEREKCNTAYEKMKKQTKEKLNISKIYLSICELSHQIMDKELFAEYQKKLKQEEQRWEVERSLR